MQLRWVFGDEQQENKYKYKYVKNTECLDSHIDRETATKVSVDVKTAGQREPRQTEHKFDGSGCQRDTRARRRVVNDGGLSGQAGDCGSEGGGKERYKPDVMMYGVGISP